MNLFKNIFRNKGQESRGSDLNNPAVPLSAAGFFSWAFGGEPTAAGELVTADSALHLIPVYACVRVLADGVASLPIKVYKTDDKGKHIIPSNGVARLLSSEPNDEMSIYSLIAAMITALMLNGNCYVEIQRNSSGLPIGLWPIHPALTDIVRDENGNISYTTTDTPDKRVRNIQPKDMIHVPYLCLNGLKGLSPIGLAKQGIGLTIAAEKYGARFFGNSAVTSGILANKSATTMSEEQKKLLRQSWDQAQSGANQHRTAVLNGDWTYTPISVSPEDSQFLQIREFQRAEIAALFNVPASKIGDTSKQSKASAEQENLSFVIDTLRPICVRLEQEFLRKLFPGQPDIVVEFDVSERLRGDFQTTMTGLAVGRQWGILSENDCRKILDMNPSDDPAADIRWAPVNMQNAARLMDTESIQDQPINTDPTPTATPPSKPEDDPAQERKSLAKEIEYGFGLMFRDAMGRTIQRPADKRNQETITLNFDAVVRSIANTLGADEKHITSALEGLGHRAGRWSHLDTDGPTEFKKIIRTLHINAKRDQAAKDAEQELLEV